jgi:enoyl-CoA hydratase/carnithine racemase
MSDTLRSGCAAQVDTEINGPVAQVTLNRPEARNAVDLRFAREIDEALTGVEEDDAVRVIVLAANGPAFCAGADLKALAAGEAEAFIGDRGWASITARDRTKPLIAAVEGAAVAGGCEIVLACDLAVASSTATFGLPEVRHGLLAAAGGAARLPGAVGPKLAMEMLLTGEPIDAARALAVGLVNRLVAPADVRATAHALAHAISRHTPTAVEAARRVATAAVTQGEQAAQRLAPQLLETLLVSPDASGRLASFSASSGRRFRLGDT